jgi:hypothetical protein
VRLALIGLRVSCGWSVDAELTIGRAGSEEGDSFECGVVARPTSKRDLLCAAHRLASDARSAIHSVGTKADLVEAETKTPFMPSRIHDAVWQSATRPDLTMVTHRVVQPVCPVSHEQYRFVKTHRLPSTKRERPSKAEVAL